MIQSSGRFLYPWPHVSARTMFFLPEHPLWTVWMKHIHINAGRKTVAKCSTVANVYILLEAVVSFCNRNIKKKRKTETRSAGLVAFKLIFMSTLIWTLLMVKQLQAYTAKKNKKKHCNHTSQIFNNSAFLLIVLIFNG